MTGDRFDTPRNPRDFTGQLAIKLHREHQAKLARQRALEEAADEAEYLARPVYGQEEVIDYTGSGPHLDSGKQKVRFEDVEYTSTTDDVE
jgi:hypothetical protein